MEEKALKEINLMVDMMLDFSNEVSIRRKGEKILISCRLTEKRTEKPFVLYCLTDKRSLFELDFGIWEAFKASVDFPFDVDGPGREINGTYYHFCVIKGSSSVCWRFACYVDPGQLRCYLDNEALV